jgi:GntR family transcriptional regulator
MAADAALANLLETELGAAVVRIERVTFTTGDKPIDFEYLYYRGDSFQYFVTVGRRRDVQSPSSQGE